MDIIRITIGFGNNIIFYINSYLLGAIIIILMIVAIYISRPKKLSLKKAFSIDEAEIGIGHQKIKLVPNEQDIQIAYKLWVELSTRKIGLEIDYEYDLIYEVYRSWYSFFSIARELIKEIPAEKARKYESTETLINLSIKILNEVLRPHLTRWQAEFNRWYKNEINLEKNKDIAPQNIQKSFPQYEEMIKDLQRTNLVLIKYREKMGQLAYDKNE